MIYYRRYLGDYSKKTSRLSMLEHGAYSMMLDAYYLEEEPLPLPVDKVYEICKAFSKEAREAVDNVLKKYFTKQKDGWHNKRADEEIAASQRARENGGKGGRPKTRRQTHDETHDVTHEGGLEANRNGTTVQPSSLSTLQPSNHPPTGGAEEETPSPGTARGAMAAALRSQGVTGVTPSHPLVVQWVEAGVSIGLLRDAVTEARDSKPAPEALPVNYLTNIVERLRAGPAAHRGNGHPAPARDTTCGEILEGGKRCGAPGVFGNALGTSWRCREHEA
jgi:uncharacterized protein YdaU (DUF1376 family)